MMEVMVAGMLDLVMDLGRPGYRSQGVPEGGAADRPALIGANRLVGNADSAAGIEVLFRGPKLRFPEGGRIAITGADMETSLDGVSIPCGQTVTVAPGGTLDVGLAKRGLRAYLAVAGGIDVPEVLGSRSTFLPVGFGGWQGRALGAGDVLPVGAPMMAGAGKIREKSQQEALRLLPGPQLAGFSDLSLQALTGSPYVVSNDSNRLGMRLSGQALGYEGGELRSQAVLPGAIQVPPGGEPIVLGWDGPVTGGYPVIAGIISADLHRFAQMRPGELLTFRFVGLEEAREAAQEFGRLLDEAIVWQD